MGRILGLWLSVVVVMGFAPARAEALPLSDGLYAEITTPRGVIVAELAFETAPLTVLHFIGLAEGTLGPKPHRPFYDGSVFHRVVPGFVIQGGAAAPGLAGIDYAIPDEIAPGLRYDQPGILGLANSGPDTNGSEFFITLSAVPRLNYVYPAFGRVVGGAEILDRIVQGDDMHIRILRIGVKAQAVKADETAFTTRLNQTTRLPPPHFDEDGDVISGEKPWWGKNLETKLANAERSLGLSLYVRLFEKFEPNVPGQTPQQELDAYRRRYHLPKGAELIGYFADRDQWLIAKGGTSGVELPFYTPRPGPMPASDDQAAVRSEKSRRYNSTVDLLNEIIFAAESKASGSKANQSKIKRVNK
jgi:cyclophilin family peptidyl-prolyl cis-trans isomerase